MKKLFSIVISIFMLVSIFVLPNTVSAATNDANSFKTGTFVKCGGYYFFVDSNKNGRSTLYRVNSNGKKKKAISSITFYSKNNLLSYKNKLYFSSSKGVLCYNPKNNKKNFLKKGNYDAVGICSRGVISQDYSTGLTLISFKKNVKKVASNSNEYLCSNNRYFFYYSNKLVGSKYKISMKRFNLSKNKSEKASTFTVNRGWNSTINCYLAHVFKNTIMFTIGSYEGTMLNYSGSLYKMNSKGTGVKKILNQSVNKFTPGKGCIYATYNPIYDYSLSECYKITSNGKCAKVKGSMGFRESTSNNYYIFAKKTNTSSENFYSRYVAKGKSKKIFNGSSFIKSSDPYNAYVQGKGIDSYGNMALFQIRVCSPEGGIGWRPLLLRTYTYMVNLKTGSKTLVSTTNNV